MSGLDLDALREEARRLESLYSGSSSSKRSDINWYNMELGRNKLRVLPPWEGSKRFGKIRLIHRNLPGARNRHVCIGNTWPEKGVPCPICAVVTKLNEKGIDAWSFKPVPEVWINVVPRQGPNADKVSIARITPGIYNELMQWAFDEDIGNCTDINNGFDIIITKESTGNRAIDVRYSLANSTNRGPVFIDSERNNAILKDIYNLDVIFSFPSDEIIKEIETSARLLESQFFSGDPVTSATDNDESKKLFDDLVLKASNLYSIQSSQVNKDHIAQVASMINSKVNVDDLWNKYGSISTVTTDSAPSSPAPNNEKQSYTSSYSSVKSPDEAIDILVNKLGFDKKIPNPSVDIPEGAPNCFSYHSVVSDTFPKVCLLCRFEEDCRESSE